MAKSKSKRSKASRAYRGVKAAFKKKTRRRRGSSSGFGGVSSRGFLALPGRPIDLALGGAGVVASGMFLPRLVARIPVAALQSGYGNAAATAVVGALLGGLVAKANKSAGIGLAVGAIGAGLAKAIATARGGAVEGYMPGSEFAYPMLNGYMPNNPAFDTQLSGYVAAQ